MPAYSTPEQVHQTQQEPVITEVIDLQQDDDDAPTRTPPMAQTLNTSCRFRKNRSITGISFSQRLQRLMLLQTLTSFVLEERA